MARWFFPCVSGRTYKGDGTQLVETNYSQGQSTFTPNGNLRSLVIFDASYVREVLGSQIVTACYFDFYVETTYFTSGAVAVVGTHNYTSVPTTWDDSRVNQDRFRRNVARLEQVTGFDLGSTVGNELRNGVSTGVALGPGPNSNYDYALSISPDGSPTEPVLVVDSISFNFPPYAPTLTSPTEGLVLNSGNQSTTFSWVHRDPNANVQAGYFFNRIRPNGTSEWWNATTQLWQSTSVRNTSATQSVTFTATQWNSTASGRYQWRVATSDFQPLDGPYAPYRSFWQSTPPVVDITEPGTLVTTPRPVVRWNYSDPDGDVQYGWVVRIYTPDVYGAVGFNPNDSTTYIWQGTALNTATFTTPTIDLGNHKTYRVYVWAASSPSLAGGFQVSNPDYVELQVAISPYAPTITYPRNGSVVDLAAGFALSWQNNHYGGEGSQSGFAIRRLTGTSTYQWWNGSSWGTTETFLAGSNTVYSFRPSEVANGQTFTFSVVIRDAYGQTSAYATGSTVRGSTAAQVTVLSPPATVVVVNPTVTWSVYDPDNDPQQTYQVRVINSSIYDVGISDPGTATAVWDSGEIASANARSVQIPVDLDNTDEYRAYVRVRTGGVASGWSYAEFSVAITPPATPSATAVVVEDAGAIDIIIQGRDSLLSVDTARGVSGWSSFLNCTVTTGIQYESAESDIISNVSATVTGTMSAHSTDPVNVVPGETYTAAVTVIVATGDTPVESYVSIQFLSQDDVEVSVISGNIVFDESALRTSVTGTAPGSASKARARITFRSIPTAGDVHGFYDPILRPGTGVEWSPGGLAGTVTVSTIETIYGRIPRRSLNVPLASPLQRVTVRDEEVPMGLDQRYEVVARAVYDELVLTSATRVLDVVRWTSGQLWLSDPLRPGSGRAYAPQSFDATTRPVRQGKFRPIGRSDAVITTGIRGLREGSFVIVTHDRVSRAAFLDLVNESEIVLLRIPPDTADPVIADHEGETIYVRLEGDAPEERPIPHRTPHRVLTQAWTEQQRPLDNLEYVEGGGII